jgi:TctA family transporter
MARVTERQNVINGDWSTLVDRPFAAIVLVLALLALVVPLVPGWIARLLGRRLESVCTGFGEED